MNFSHSLVLSCLWIAEVNADDLYTIHISTTLKLQFDSSLLKQCYQFWKSN